MRPLISRALVRLLPREFSRQFGDDLLREWRGLRRDARIRGGRLAEWRYLARESGAFLRLMRELRAAGSAGVRPAHFTGVDFRDAARRFRTRPALALGSIVMLTAAVAASAVAFGVGRAVLWRPLPFPGEARLVFVWERGGAPATPMRVTAARFADWTERTTAFDSLAAFGAGAFQVEHADGIATIRGVRVTAGFFDTLGITPAIGRGFTPSDHAPGAARVVLLSREYWRRYRGADIKVVGQTMRIGGELFTIVGVLPEVWLPAWPVNPATVTLDADARQLWLPIPLPDPTRRAHVLGVIGRLADGRTPQSAEEDLQALADPAHPDPHGAAVRPLRDQVAGGSRQSLLVLLTAALSVWLVSCLNLAALRLADFEQRRADFATRLALGATVSRVSIAVCVEAAILTGVAATGAVAVTHAVLQALPARLSAQVPFVTAPRVDTTVLVFVSVLAAVAVVLMSAWPLARLRGIRGLAAPRRVTASSAAFRGLVVAQLAGTVVLVATSAVLVRSSWAVQDRETGFDMRDVWIANVSLPPARYATPASLVAFEDLLLSRTDASAWSGGLALAYDHPLEANWIDAVTLVGDAQQSGGDGQLAAQLRIVSPSYFEVMRVETVEGRTFGVESGSGEAGVVVVNEAFFRQWQAGVGRHVRLSSPRATWGTAAPATFAVVGVVEDERTTGREGAPEPAVYVSTRQFPQSELSVIGRRAPGRPDAPAALRAAVREAEPQASLGSVEALERIDADQRLPRTVTTDLVTAFAGVALVLAALGLHSLLSLVVASRRREIGIRLALGATRGGVASLVVRDSLRAVGLGLVAGLVLAQLADEGTRALLVDGGGTDVILLVGIVVLMLGLAAVTAALPARRASRVDPAETLNP
jgi:predicted permease